MREIDPLSTAFLLVETNRGGDPVWAAKWRSADGTRVSGGSARRRGSSATATRGGRVPAGRSPVG